QGLENEISLNEAETISMAEGSLDESAEKMDEIGSEIIENTNKVDEGEKSSVENTNGQGLENEISLNEAETISMAEGSLDESTEKMDESGSETIEDTSKVDEVEKSSVENTNGQGLENEISLNEIEIQEITEENLVKNNIKTAEEILVEEILVEEVLVEEVLVEEILAEEVLAEEILLEEVLAEEILSEEVLAEEILVEEILVEENLKEEILVEENLKEEILVEENLKEEVLVEENLKEEILSEIVIIHTNDIHCAIEDNIGYAGVAAFEKEMNEQYGEENVLLVDAGDAIQGGPIGKLTEGEAIIDIMNEVDYDIFVLGNHEFDYKIPRMIELMNKLEADVVSANFMNVETKEPVFLPYTITRHNGVEIAFVGITTPETFTKSTPTYFQNKDGEFIYRLEEDKTGESLYACVQGAVNSAIESGVDYVVALGHLGIDEQSTPWKSTDVISNTTGIDVFIDGHSHSVVDGELIKNSEGEDVLLTQTGTKFDNIGRVIINPNTKEITSELISSYEKKDEGVEKLIEEINAEFELLLNEVVANSDVTLATVDPESGERLIRNRETNMGDIVADAYRHALGTDVALVNAGGIRADIKAGEVTVKDIIDVHPFGNDATSIMVTGQTILDALEMGAKNYPGESGGFLQVSGLEYTIDSRIAPSVITNDQGAFVKVDGEYRVKNVLIGGEELELNKEYSVGSHNYMLLDLGDGMSMFKGAQIIKDKFMVDNEVLINYIQDELDGDIVGEYENIYGEGRITIIEEPIDPEGKKIEEEEIDVIQKEEIEETNTDSSENIKDSTIIEEAPEKGSLNGNIIIKKEDEILTENIEMTFIQVESDGTEIEIEEEMELNGGISELEIDEIEKVSLIPLENTATKIEPAKSSETEKKLSSDNVKTFIKDEDLKNKKLSALELALAEIGLTLYNSNVKVETEKIFPLDNAETFIKDEYLRNKKLSSDNVETFIKDEDLKNKKLSELELAEIGLT
ncbi:hypothetical protein AN643_04160, partial [Candidatus Epulonipiscioides saccharophilum]